jgi:Domain of unknown function (DUF4365)
MLSILNIRDYCLWVNEPNPVFLILYEASSRRAYWLYFQEYFKSATAPKPKAKAKTVRIKIPMVNRVRKNFFRHARHLKEQILNKLMGADPHA